MAEYNFPIPGSEDEKDVVLFVRRHWVAFLGQFLLSFVILMIPAIILIYFFSSGLNEKIFKGFGYNITVLFLSVYYLIAVTFAFVAWISFYYDIYIVTRLEIIEITQEGFFGRKTSQLSMLRVQDISCSVKGILPTFFNYGDVLVETASEQKEVFLLSSVPNPQEICSKIMNLHDEILEREGRQEQASEGEGAFIPPRKNQNNEIKTENLSNPIPAPVSSTDTGVEKTPYQQMLEKERQEKEEQSQPPAVDANVNKNNEGEINKDDLNQGGEVSIK